jgi:hypothetical protein
VDVAVSSSEADKPEPNKSYAFRALPAPPTPIEIEGTFPSLILTLPTKAFSIRLSHELPEINFLLGFRAFAIANSYAKV